MISALSSTNTIVAGSFGTSKLLLRGFVVVTVDGVVGVVATIVAVSVAIVISAIAAATASTASATLATSSAVAGVGVGVAGVVGVVAAAAVGVTVIVASVEVGAVAGVCTVVVAVSICASVVAVAAVVSRGDGGGSICVTDSGGTGDSVFCVYVSISDMYIFFVSICTPQQVVGLSLHTAYSSNPIVFCGKCANPFNKN